MQEEMGPDVSVAVRSSATAGLADQARAPSQPTMVQPRQRLIAKMAFHFSSGNSSIGAIFTGRAMTQERSTAATIMMSRETTTTGHSAWETFLRAVGCNWLVCLAVWMALADPAGIQAAIGWLLGDLSRAEAANAYPGVVAVVLQLVTSAVGSMALARSGYLIGSAVYSPTHHNELEERTGDEAGRPGEDVRP